MRKIQYLGIAIAIASISIGCTKSDKDDTANNLLLLAMLPQPANDSIGAQFPNSVTGTTENVRTSAGVATGVSSAVSTGATGTPSSLIRAAQEESLSRSLDLLKNTQICDGTERTLTQRYTTSRTQTGSPTHSTLRGGSYTVTPDLTVTVRYRCYPSGNTSPGYQNIEQTGSVTVHFNNATIRSLDIAQYVADRTVQMTEVTLHGTIRSENIRNTTNISTSGSLGQSFNLTGAGTSSSTESADNFTINNGQPLSIRLSQTSGVSANSVLNTSITPNCYSTYRQDIGLRVNGTIGGETVALSYNLNTDDLLRLWVAQGSSFRPTMCQ